LDSRLCSIYDERNPETEHPSKRNPPMELASWSAAAPAIGAAFLASLVEVVEAFTIVLAVGVVRGWRPAFLGTGAALFVLGAIVLLLGPLLDRVPLHLLQFFIGVLLLLFGMRWLRKAILRASGHIALHDEEAEFSNETAYLKALHVGDSLTSTGLPDWLRSRP
jgi:Ca2+/H+ antiporter, TMEM165/GDT1 family